MNKYLIYGLIDPITNELRYVGKSSDGLRRPKEHWRARDLHRLQDHCHRWVRSVFQKTKGPPEIIIIEETTKEELSNAEVFYIAYYKSLGADLTNLTAGGEGGGRPCKKIIRNDGVIFQSLREAAKSVNSSPGQVCFAIRKNYRVKGYEFKYLTQGHNMVWDCHKFPKHAVRVKRSDGKIFNSIKEAARDLGVKPSMICNAIRFNRKTRGYNFTNLGKAIVYASS